MLSIRGGCCCNMCIYIYTNTQYIIHTTCSTWYPATWRKFSPPLSLSMQPGSARWTVCSPSGQKSTSLSFSEGFDSKGNWHPLFLIIFNLQPVYLLGCRAWSHVFAFQDWCSPPRTKFVVTGFPTPLLCLCLCAWLCILLSSLCILVSTLPQWGFKQTSLVLCAPAELFSDCTKEGRLPPPSSFLFLVFLVFLARVICELLCPDRMTNCAKPHSTHRLETPKSWHSFAKTKFHSISAVRKFGLHLCSTS